MTVYTQVKARPAFAGLAPTFQLVKGGNPRLTLRQVSFRNGDILPHAIHSVVNTSLPSLS